MTVTPLIVAPVPSGVSRSTVMVPDPVKAPAAATRRPSMSMSPLALTAPATRTASSRVFDPALMVVLLSARSLPVPPLSSTSALPLRIIVAAFSRVPPSPR
jgi:hypothetical protein